MKSALGTCPTCCALLPSHPGPHPGPAERTGKLTACDTELAVRGLAGNKSACSQPGGAGVWPALLAEVKDFLLYELRKKLFLGSSFLLGAHDEGQWTEFLGVKKENTVTEGPCSSFPCLSGGPSACQQVRQDAEWAAAGAVGCPPGHRPERPSWPWYSGGQDGHLCPSCPSAALPVLLQRCSAAAARAPGTPQTTASAALSAWLPPSWVVGGRRLIVWISAVPGQRPVVLESLMLFTCLHGPEALASQCLLEPGPRASPVRAHAACDCAAIAASQPQLLPPARWAPAVPPRRSLSRRTDGLLFPLELHLQNSDSQRAAQQAHVFHASSCSLGLLTLPKAPLLPQADSSGEKPP